MAVFKKESVELNLAYQSEGCGKTRMKINDTMPHTWIVWVYAQSVHSRIATQEMSAVRYPIALKTVRFSIQDCENTFNMSATLSK